jgi:hypothetical protein
MTKRDGYLSPREPGVSPAEEKMTAFERFMERVARKYPHLGANESAEREGVAPVAPRKLPSNRQP